MKRKAKTIPQYEFGFVVDLFRLVGEKEQDAEPRLDEVAWEEPADLWDKVKLEEVAP